MIVVIIVNLRLTSAQYSFLARRKKEHRSRDAGPCVGHFHHREDRESHDEDHDDDHDEDHDYHDVQKNIIMRSHLNAL